MGQEQQKTVKVNGTDKKAGGAICNQLGQLATGQ